MPSSVIIAAAQFGLGAALGLQQLTMVAFIKFMAFNVGAQLLLRGVGKALADSSGSGISNAQNLTTNLRSPISPRRVIYGQRRVGGTLVYAQSRDAAGTDKQLNLIIALAGHEVQEIGDIWLDDKVVPLDGSGNATSAPYKITPPDIPVHGESGTVGTIPYAVTLAHSLGQIQSVSVYDSSTDSYTVPAYTVSGSVVTFTSAADQGRVWQVTYEEAVATESYARIKKYLGTGSQTADADLISVSDGKWTSAHRLRGIAYVYAALKSNREVFPNGIPNITAVVKGKKVYDPRTATTAWSQNPALILADYLCDAKYGLGCVYADEIDETALIAAANVCDESVALAAGGTESRYRCDLAFDSTARPSEVIQQILTSMAGTCVYVGGKWRIQAGAYVAPTVTLTESDLRGPVRIQSRVSRRDQFNAVRGTFVSVADNWQPTDFPAIVSSTFKAEDNGETVYKDIELTATLSATAAQRLAKIDLLRARQQITVNLACKLTAYQVQPGDTVALTLARYGWTAKVFEVQSSNFALDQDGTLGIDLTLRETASSVWSWSTSEEQAFDPAPDTDLPDAFSTQPPTGVTLAAASLALQGVTTSDLVVSWTASTTPFASRYEVQWRLIQGTDWTSVSVDAGVLDARLPGAMSGGTYIARVRALSAVSVPSSWAYSSSFTAGAVGTPSYGSAANLLRNAAMRDRVFPWARYPGAPDLLSGWTLAHSPPSGVAAPNPYGAIVTYGGGTNTWTGWTSTQPNLNYSERIAVLPNTRYEVQLRAKTIEGRGRLKVKAFNASGGQVADEVPSGGVSISTNNDYFVSNAIEDYDLLWGFFTTPATAEYVRVYLETERPASGSDTYYFVGLPLLGEAGAYQTLPSPWAEGESAVNADMIADQSATIVEQTTDATGVTSSTASPSYVTLISDTITNNDTASRDVIVSATITYSATRASGTLTLEFYLHNGSTYYLLGTVSEATETSAIKGTVTISRVFSLAASATLSYSARARQANNSGSSTFSDLVLRAELVKK
jgi:hypothetical protein